MQFIGVIREHEDGLYKIGQPLCEFIEAKNTYDDLPRIIQYLETGAILMELIIKILLMLSSKAIFLLFILV